MCSKFFLLFLIFTKNIFSIVPSSQVSVAPPVAPPVTPAPTIPNPAVSPATTSSTAQKVAPAPIHPVTPVPRVSPVLEKTEESPELELYKYKQSIEMLKGDVDKIEQSEDQLLNLLKELEGKIDQAQEKAFQAQIVDREILSAGTTEDAQAKLDALKQKYESIKNIQKDLKENFSQKIDKELAYIQSQMSALDGKIQQISVKGEALSKKEEQRLQEQEKKEQELAEKKKVEEKKAKKKIHIKDRAVGAVAFVVKFVGDLGSWVKSLFYKPLNIVEVKEEKADEKEVGKIAVALPEVKEEKLVDTKPTSTHGMIVKKLEKRKKSFEAAITDLIKQKKQVEEQQKMLEELKDQRLTQMRADYEKLKKAGIEPEVLLGEAKPKSRIRRGLEYMFGKVLDVSTLIFNKTKDFSVALYQKYLAPKVQGFVSAVKAKVKKSEQAVVPVEKPAPAKQKIAAPTTVSPPLAKPVSPKPTFPVSVSPKPIPPKPALPIPPKPVAPVTTNGEKM